MPIVFGSVALKTVAVSSLGVIMPDQLRGEFHAGCDEPNHAKPTGSQHFRFKAEDILRQRVSQNISHVLENGLVVIPQRKRLKSLPIQVAMPASTRPGRTGMMSSRQDMYPQT